jgi:hypothetical protein
VFLVQLTSGREQVYPTRAEFVAAIRSGEIAATSLIFHRATARWISITEHPEYRRFREELRSPAGAGAAGARESLTPAPGSRVPGPLRHLAKIGAWLGRKTTSAPDR